MSIKYLNLSLSSIEEYCSSIKHFDLEAFQISKGAYSSNNEILLLSKIMIEKMNTQTTILHRGVLSSEHFFFIIPDIHLEIPFNNINMASSNLIAIHPNEEIFTTYQKGLSGIGITIPIQIFLDNFGFADLSAAQVQTSKVRKKLANKSTLMKKQLIGYIHNLFTLRHKLPPQAIYDAENNIIDAISAIFNLFCEPNEKIKVIPFDKRREVVRRAMDFLKATSEVNITVAELSTICFCSIRSLEYAFQNILRISPKKFLMYRRLNIIRKMFQDQSHSKKQVRHILQHFGIINEGRFAQSYFDLFEEYPLETLKKSNFHLSIWDV